MTFEGQIQVKNLNKSFSSSVWSCKWFVLFWGAFLYWELWAKENIIMPWEVLSNYFRSRRCLGNAPKKSHFSLGILRIQNCDNNNGTDWVITKLSPIFKYTHANSCLPFFLKAEWLPNLSRTCKAAFFTLRGILICEFTLIDARLQNDTAQFARASHPPRRESSLARLCVSLVAYRNWRSWRFWALLVVVGWFCV